MSSYSVSNHTRDKQIGLPLRGRWILLITRVITDRIGLHLVLLPLLILSSALCPQRYHKKSSCCGHFKAEQPKRSQNRFLTLKGATNIHVLSACFLYGSPLRIITVHYKAQEHSTFHWK